MFSKAISTCEMVFSRDLCRAKGMCRRSHDLKGYVVALKDPCGHVHLSLCLIFSVLAHNSSLDEGSDPLVRGTGLSVCTVLRPRLIDVTLATCL